MQFDWAFFFDFVFHPRPALLRGVMVTVLSTFAAMSVGVVLGTLLALLGSARFAPLRVFRQGYVFVFRGTPLLVQVIIIYFGLPYFIGIDLFPRDTVILGVGISGAIVAGVTAFALHEAAYFSEIARAAIASVDRGQWDAARALGMGPRPLMTRIVLPQAVRIMLPPLGNQFNGMFKATSLLSLVAVPEMLFVTEAIHAVTYKSFEVYLGISVYYLLLTGLWGRIQSLLERRYSRGFAMAH